MNILIISEVFYPEPVVSARLSEALAIELSKTEDVTVVCPKPTRPVGVDYNKCVFDKTTYKRIALDSYTCPFSSFVGRMRETYSFGRATVRYLKQNKDHIDCIYMNTFPLFAQYMTIAAAKKYNIPIATHIQDIYPESMLPRLGPILSLIFGSALIAVDRHYIRLSNRIITISENMEKYLAETRGLTDDQSIVIRNWQDDSLFMNIEKKERNDKFTFMFVGSISPAAGVDFILKAFLDSNLKDCCLHIVGNGSQRIVCEKLAAVNKDMDIRFSNVSPDYVPTIQAAADVLLLPLKRGVGKTATPSKLVAYMLSAKPVIAAIDNGSDAGCIIKKANCGWVVEAEDKKALTLMMKKTYASSKDDLRRLGENGQVYALDHFSKEHNLKKLVHVILNLKK